MTSKKIQFSNAEGQQLSAIIQLPEIAEPAGFALFAHCFTCNKNLTAVRNIARSLTNNGIAVLLFDFTGLGESEGQFENTNFSSNIEDLLAAANFLKEAYRAPDILIGHSLGGAAVIFASAKIKTVKAVATIGAPCSPGHIRHLLKAGLAEINQKGIAEISIGGRSFFIKQQFLQDIEEQKLDEIIHQMKKPLLIMHSPQDAVVGIENAAHLYKAASHPKNFISLDGADHLLSKAEDSLFAGEIISTWAKRYLPHKADD